jgi:hypothetical protein
LVACPLVFFVAFALENSACASIIISDTFTAPDDTALIGRLAAPIDTPGTTYAGNGNVSLVGGFTGGTPYEADIQMNSARVGADAGLAINLGINTPAQFQLSISFNISDDTQTQADDPHRGASLGFFSSVSLGSSGSSHGFKNFTGLVVDRAGSVRLIIAGANSGIATTVGGFDPAVIHTLSFSVDTTAGIGSISNILLDASSVTLSAPANTFTVARTALAGFYNSSFNPADLANFDDFFVATVPESSSLSVVFGFALLVGISDFCSRRIRSPRDKRRGCAPSKRTATTGIGPGTSELSGGYSRRSPVAFGHASSAARFRIQFISDGVGKLRNGTSCAVGGFTSMDEPKQLKPDRTRFSEKFTARQLGKMASASGRGGCLCAAKRLAQTGDPH